MSDATSDIRYVMKILRCQNVKNVGSRSVMGSCPLAPYLHSDGTDNRPSFGILMTSPPTFNCFACGMKGKLTYLPFLLSRYTGFYNRRLSEVIQNIQIIEVDNRRVELSDNHSLWDLLSTFESPLPKWKLSNMEVNEKLWKLRFDPEKKAMVFPIFDGDGNLIALKGRKIGEKQFFQYNEFPIKRAGVWYGMHQKHTKKIILCEGERDAILVSYLKGVAWASLGASITMEQIETLRRQNKEYILMFDDDDAGREARDFVISKCRVFNRLYVIEDYFGCKDPAELVEKGLMRKALETMKIFG